MCLHSSFEIIALSEEPSSNLNSVYFFFLVCVNMLRYSLLSFFLLRYHIQEILLSHFLSAVLMGLFESDDRVCLDLKKKKKGTRKPAVLWPLYFSVCQIKQLVCKRLVHQSVRHVLYSFSYNSS